MELDWILADAIRRHIFDDNEGRTGVFIRGTTRGLDQKLLVRCLSTQRRFKGGDWDTSQTLCLADYSLVGAITENSIAAVPESEMLSALREDVLAGGYYLIDYRGYANYEPGDNVVNILVMGALTPEAVMASENLFKQGVYANVIVCTNTDLLVGNLGHADGYRHLREGLQLTGQLYLSPNGTNGREPHVHQLTDLIALQGRRVPMVSVHDGEPGLLDNVGSIIGARQESLAVRRHSKSGRPSDIYSFHSIDAAAIQNAAENLLRETAAETFYVTASTLADFRQHQAHVHPKLLSM